MWAYVLRHAPDGVGHAEEALRELAEPDLSDVPEQLLEADEAAAFRQFTDGLLRESLGMASDGA